jgi:hypothetical protein
MVDKSLTGPSEVGFGSDRDGTPEPADGTLEPEDGTLEPTDGTLEPEDGTLEPEDRTLEPADGTLEPEDRTLEPTDGTLEPEDGTLAPADGTLAPEGRGMPGRGSPESRSVRPGEWRSDGDASPPLGAARGSGSSVQSQSLALTSTGSTATPWSRASRTIWAGA